jgi:6-phosphogluconolactonase (cycloisomerase 2 family)
MPASCASGKTGHGTDGIRFVTDSVLCSVSGDSQNFDHFRHRGRINIGFSSQLLATSRQSREILREHCQESRRHATYLRIVQFGSKDPVTFTGPRRSHDLARREEIAMECVTGKCVVRPDAARSVACFEVLESRRLMSASALADFSLGHSHGSEFVYVESNNPQPGQNEVIALRRNPSNGSLRQVGTFLTGGTGFGNVTQGLGPDDSDQEVIASPDGRLLFAVNQGSNSIAVFHIRSNGRLDLVGTFDSGGTQPVSLGLSGDHLYVANRGDALQNHTATIAPNYTAFDVGDDGALTPIPGSTITLPIGLSPAQTLIARNGKFLFGNNFAIPGTTPPLGQTIDPFQIQPDGTLAPAPSGPVAANVTPNVLLGTATHPTLPIIYGGLTGTPGIAVFTFDNQGSVQFVASVPDQGAAPCWLTVSADGKYLYASNTGTDSIGVFSLADPLHPVQVQEFKLAGPFAPPGVSGSQTASFQIALDPSGQNLYVITQDTAATRDFQQGNAVHALSVAADGTLSEGNPSVTFSPADVPAAARLQGVAVVSLASRHGDDDDDDDSRGDRAFAPALAQGSSFAFGENPIGQSERDASSVLSALVDLAGGRDRGQL